MRYGPAIQPPNETVTEGLDGLRDRLREYHGMGCAFREAAGGHPPHGRSTKFQLRECKCMCAGATLPYRRAGSARGRVAHDQPFTRCSTPSSRTVTERRM